MPQIALFGTSADPPTRGHQALMEELLQLYPRVATWASDNPKKQHGAPLDLRAQLLQALVKQIQELSDPFTIRTLQRAGQRWPDAELVFVVGSDLASQIPSWKQTDQWLPYCRLAIAPRQGWPLTAVAIQQLKQLGARLDQLVLSLPASASSALRERPRKDQLPESVWPLLIEHNLYGLNSSSRC